MKNKVKNILFILFVFTNKTRCEKKLVLSKFKDFRTYSKIKSINKAFEIFELVFFTVTTCI